MLVKIEARILIFPGTDFHFPSTSVPPGTFFRLFDALWSTDSQKKTSKFDATKCRILRLKCTKSDFRWRPSSKGMDGKGRGREGNGTGQTQKYLA